MSNKSEKNEMNENEKLNLMNKIDNSRKNRLIILASLGILGLTIRLYFFPYDVPLFGDAQGYFWYANDMSILNQFPVGHSLTNNGWPVFLSGIFQVMDTNSFLDYHNIQRFVGVIFSVITIIPIYYLCSKFFKKSYSILAASAFIFEPRLIQNSFSGTPESLYIFLMAMILVLFMTNNFKKIYFSFALIALLSLVRYEGFLLIIPISIVFFLRFRKQKRNLIKFGICILIFSLFLVPMSYLKNETMGQDGVISHISAGPKYYQDSINTETSSMIDFLYTGISNLIKFAGWIQIPYFIMFVPLGLVLIFRKLDNEKILIISIIITMLIPAFYGYSRGFAETKYLFIIIPSLCFVSCFAFQFILDKIPKKEFFFCIILGGIILSSFIFVELKSIDNLHYQEAFKILNEIGQKEMKINKDFGTHGGEFMMFNWIELDNSEKFPILRNELPPSKISYTFQIGHYHEKLEESNSIDLDKAVRESSELYGEINNLEKYFEVLEKQKITHLILDKYNNVRTTNDELRIQLRDIFLNENEYPFLIKEYDSKESGYNYHIKLFKINYKDIDE
mgnify:CR=1 FL=1